jgi:hypothetical protein
MSIRFVCEFCGHSIELDDRFAGKRGKCKHCRKRLIVPARSTVAEPAAPADEPGALRLKPQSVVVGLVPADLLAPGAPLQVRAAEAEPRPKPVAVSAPDEAPSVVRRRWRDLLRAGDSSAQEYKLVDPSGGNREHSAAGPPSFWMILPSLTARFFAGRLRSLRDWLYVVSLVGLVIALYGYLFSLRGALHTGAIIVVAANISMLCVGVTYLVMLPFKDSLVTGLANLFPPYAVYYWIKHWKKMRRPVLNTLASFLPIALVGLAYLVYEEAPVLKKKLPEIEQKLEAKFDQTIKLPSEEPATDH